MADVPRLLIVHHTPSPAMHAMYEAVHEGATDPAVGDVQVVSRAALEATVPDVLTADAYVLGTPANLGTMSGALKHFFDTIYYPCLESTRRRPYALYVHGGNDVDGAVRDVERIVTGLRWQVAQAPVRVTGTVERDDLGACWELGAAVAAGLGL